MSEEASANLEEEEVVSAEEEQGMPEGMGDDLEDAQEPQEGSSESDENSQNEASQKPSTPEEEAAKWKEVAARAQADLENYRKRMVKEKADSYRFANAALLETLFPIIDNFEMGLEAARQESQDSMIFKGMEMVGQQWKGFLSDQGVEVVPAEGAFDPTVHEAVAQEVSEEIEAGHVLRVVRKGYRLHERLLRAANVVVAQSEAEAAQGAEADGEEETSEKEGA